MNELKSLEHATLKRVMDVEARAVGAVAGELDGAARAPTPTPTPTPAAGEITELLGGMSINEELQAALVCKKRLEHLKEQAVTLTEPSTPQVRCYNAATQVAACPACAAPLNQLARTLPHAHVSHSRLVCRLSRAPLNEHNQPMALPNGQVYGEQALKEMMNEHGSIVCPKTNEVFCMKRVEKVYVM
ncbi:hypothetical protein MSG28_014301 [Choristoneura fumiferana]|uniref:Uncharacterized protein n=1 Tax=Choristoneura fumiferana TaxID=7141 RepID=A0ACC0JGK7_CHOFU|nr:hypothetical protein MSG28_014301 [Choristoneura fumiferana]